MLEVPPGNRRRVLVQMPRSVPVVLGPADVRRRGAPGGHVLPDVPVRQEVLTAPHEVRRVLALRPDALTAQGRTFVEEIARWQKHAANANGETGADTFVPRFDSTLGCFVQFHVLVPDGVFTRANGDGAVVFREGPAPTRGEIASVAARVEKRMRRWLRRRDLLDGRPEEDRSSEAPELSPLEACLQLSLFGSTSSRLAKDGAAVLLAVDDARCSGAGKGPWVAEASGLNVHAGVTVHAGDREGLERLCRYGALDERRRCGAERVQVLLGLRWLGNRLHESLPGVGRSRAGRG